MAALLLKELRHHLFIGLSAVALSVAMLVVFLVQAIQLQNPSYLPAGALFARAVTAPLALFCAHRLFVREHQEGTYELVQSLPVRPWLPAVVKISVGLLFLLFVVEGGVLVVASLAAHREIVSEVLLRRVLLRAAVHGYAWFGISVAFAQLGRHRFAAWILLFVFLGELATVAPSLAEHTLWFEVETVKANQVGQPLGQRGFVALVWGTAGLASALTLVSLEGGALVRRLFAPSEGRQRAVLTLVLAVTFVGAGLVGRLAPEHDAGARFVPEVRRGGVRVASTDEAGPTMKLGAALDRELSDLESRVGPDRWPRVVLRARHDHTQPKPITRTRHGGAVHLAVELEDEETRLRPALRAVLESAHSDWPVIDPSVAWMYPGLAQTWLDMQGRPSPVMERRAALAALTDLSPEQLSAWRPVEIRLGADLAEAVSWVGLKVAGRRCDPQLEDDLFEAAFPVRRPPIGGWLLMRRLFSASNPASSLCGLTEEELARAWKTSLETILDAHREEIASLPPVPRATFRRIPSRGGPVRLLIDVEGTLPTGSELWWSNLDPLEALEPRRLEVTRVPAEETAVRNITLPADPRARIAATVALHVPELEGHVISGWVEVPSP